MNSEQNEEDFGEVLQRAWSHKEPWFVLAGLILDPYRDLTLEQRKTQAIKSSEVSRNMLSRYLSVLARIREAAGRHDIPIERLLTPVFSATEIAVRIYDRDPASGLTALEKLKERRTTLNQLRHQLSEIERSRGGADKMARAQRIEECEIALKQFVKKQFGASTTLVRRPALVPFSKVGWIALNGDGNACCGIDVFESEGQIMEAKLIPAILLSNFFKQFYMLFHDAFQEDFASAASTTLDFFRAHSFGTLYLGTEGSIETLRPAIGSPSPDRSSDYAELEAMFAYGRGPRRAEN
jgi:hypothetical protein